MILPGKVRSNFELNRRADTRAGRMTAAPKASNWIGSTAEQRKEFCDGLEG